MLPRWQLGVLRLLLLVLLFQISTSFGLKEIQWDNVQESTIDLPDDYTLRFVWGNGTAYSTEKPGGVVDVTASSDEVIQSTTVGPSETPRPDKSSGNDAVHRQNRETPSIDASSLFNVVSGENHVFDSHFSSGAPVPSDNITITLKHLVNTSLRHIVFFCENHHDLQLVVNLPMFDRGEKSFPGYGQAKAVIGINRMKQRESITIYAAVGGVALLGLLLGGFIAYSRRKHRIATLASAKSTYPDGLNKSFVLDPVKTAKVPKLSKTKHSGASVIEDIKEAWQKKIRKF